MTLTRKQLEAGARALLRDVVPTEPGWWWRTDEETGEPEPVYVWRAFRDDDRLAWEYVPDDGERETYHVTPDGRWLAPVLTPEQADALRARVVAAEAERDQAWRDAERAAADENASADELRSVRRERDEARAEVERLRAMTEIRPFQLTLSPTPPLCVSCGNTVIGQRAHMWPTVCLTCRPEPTP